MKHFSDITMCLFLHCLASRRSGTACLNVECFGVRQTQSAGGVWVSSVIGIVAKARDAQ